MLTFSRHKRAQSDSYILYTPSQHQLARIRAALPLKCVEYQHDDIECLQDMVRQCEDFIGIMADLGLQEPLLLRTQLEAPMQTTISVTGPRTQLHYLSAIRIILGLRKKVRNSNKIKDFWKAKAKEVAGQEGLVTPSTSDIESVLDPLEPYRQAEVKGYFASQLRDQADLVRGDAIELLVSQFDVTLTSMPDDFNFANVDEGDNSSVFSGMNSPSSEDSDSDAVSSSSSWLPELADGNFGETTPPRSIPESDIPILSPLSALFNPPTSSLQDIFALDSAERLPEVEPIQPADERRFTQLSVISEVSEPEDGYVCGGSVPDVQSEGTHIDDDSSSSDNGWEADFSWEAETVSSRRNSRTSESQVPTTSVTHPPKSRLPVMKRLSRAPTRLAIAAAILDPDSKPASNSSAPAAAAEVANYNFRNHSKTSPPRPVAPKATLSSVQSSSSTPTSNRRLSWDKTLRASVNKTIKKRQSAGVEKTAPAASEKKSVPTWVPRGADGGKVHLAIRRLPAKGKENRA